jgi:mannose-1-phosphate guanylyltransferase / phosphomannomutase
MRTLLEEHRDQDVDLVDGIKVFVDDGFVLVRPDPDEPACHIVASVGDEARGRALLEEYSRRVRDACGDDAGGATLVGEAAPAPARTTA